MEVLWMNSNWSAVGSVSDRMADRNSTIGLSTTSRADEDHLQPLFSEYPDELLHFAVGACVLFTLLGVPGNFITIVALLRYTKVSLFFVFFFISSLLFSSLLDIARSSALYGCHYRGSRAL